MNESITARACWTIITAAALSLAIMPGCQKEERIRVVASTEMLEAIAAEVGGDLVITKSLFPGLTDPAHSQIGPGHMKSIGDADLLILLGWEEWAIRIPEMDNAPGEVLTTGIPGSLMLPHNHADAADSVAAGLARIYPGGEVFYRFNLADYKARIENEVGEVCGAMARYHGTRVICSDSQADFLDYLGLDIVGTYAAGEPLPPEEAERLIEVGKRNNVRLVAYGVRDGEMPGREIAEGAGAELVPVTDYPVDGSYIKALRKNVEEITRALRE